MMNLKILIAVACCLFPLYSVGQYPGAARSGTLAGAIDMHIHSSPDVFERSVSDVEAARLARDRGMAAIVLKNHVSPTGGRAFWTHEMVPEIRVYGGVVLNRAVGGINPEAVRAMTQISPLHGRVVWLPTFDAACHRAHFGLPGNGLRITDLQQQLIPEMEEILGIIAAHDLVLATGHVSPEEIKVVIDRAAGLGISRLLVTHALADTPGLSVEEMKALAAKGACFELTYLSFLSGPQSHLPFLRANHPVSIETMVEAIRQIGAEHFLLSSDLGQSGNPHPADGLSQFVIALENAGITHEELDWMIRRNPERLLQAAP